VLHLDFVVAQRFIPWVTVLRRIRSFVALCLAMVPSLTAQVPDSTHRAAPRIIGVFDSRTGEPLAGVEVIDALTGTYATTTATGTARIDFVAYRGDATLVELRKLGYQAKQLLVSKSDTAAITEVLDRAIQLAPVVSTEHYRIDRDPGLRDGFETRCQSKLVTCFRDEDLLKKQNGNLADVLIHANGITIGACGGGSGKLTASRSAQCGKIAMHSATTPPPYCAPTYFIDGIAWNPIVGTPVDVVPGPPPAAPYTPENVKSIEVYPAGQIRPLRFEGDVTCGAVVIWTK
jgi:hypothetical protein